VADEFVVPDFVEEYVGWRGWCVTPQGRLTAIVNDEAVWTPGEALPAFCAKGKRHPVPFMNCTCGFYAADSFESIVNQNYHLAGAFGRVSMWGKSIDYTGGYKSQFAYPREIWVPYTMLHCVELLAVYGVPVRLANPYSATEKDLLNGHR
jgi:hypothetical protein